MSGIPTVQYGERLANGGEYLLHCASADLLAPGAVAKSVCLGEGEEDEDVLDGGNPFEAVVDEELVTEVIPVLDGSFFGTLRLKNVALLGVFFRNMDQTAEIVSESGVKALQERTWG